MLTDTYVKMLCSHASTDETRSHLTGIHYDGQYFVSTDGHRLMAVKGSALPRYQSPRLTAGDIYDKKIFSMGALDPIGGVFPNWSQLVPSLGDSMWVFEVVIPQWMADIKLRSKNRGETYGIGLNILGQFTTGERLTTVNIAYLQPYAGMEVQLSLKDPISALRIEPLGCGDWTAVVMPMRVGGACKVKVLRHPESREMHSIKDSERPRSYNEDRVER